MDAEARRGFSGLVVAGGDHYWYGFGGCANNLPFESFVFRKDRSFPGLTDCSLNTQYDYNRSIEWSCPWLDFAGDITDTGNRYEIVLRIAHRPELPETGTVDITPRRLQEFQVSAGTRYLWENETLEGMTVQSGTTLPDDHGLLLIDEFEVSKAGNRLVIEPDATGVTDTVPGSPVPPRFALGQPHPNPFRTSTSFNLDTPEESEISIEIYDLRGRLVRRVRSGTVTAGTHLLSWDGRGADGTETRSGIYFIRMRGRGVEMLRKVVRIR